MGAKPYRIGGPAATFLVSNSLEEAGRHNFSDHTFLTDDKPSATNSTNNQNHLVTQMKNSGVSWRSYRNGPSGELLAQLRCLPLGSAQESGG